MKKEFRSFEDAKRFVHQLGLKTQKEWNEYCRSGNKPDNIPSSPDRSYKNKGWKGFGDWSGTTVKRPTYNEYKEWLQSIGVKSEKEFRKIPKSKFPKDYPKGPEGYYKRRGTWQGWSDLFGKKSRFLKVPPTIEEYKKWLQSISVKSEKELKKIPKSKFPKDYPKDPAGHYKREGTWQGWSDLFGKKSRFLKVLPTIEEYKKWLQSMDIKSQKEFRKIPKSKFPKDYPKDPYYSYKKQGTWQGWSDLSGTKSFFIKDPPTYEEYKKWLQSMDIKSQDELRNLSKSKLPKGYPKEPYYHYKKQGTWKSWGDLFETGNISPQERSKQFLSFQDARNEVRVLAKKFNIKNWDDWKKAKKEGKIPDNIPWAPNAVYSKKRKK